jgi:hypothetical protein
VIESFRQGLLSKTVVANGKRLDARLPSASDESGIEMVRIQRRGQPALLGRLHVKRLCCRLAGSSLRHATGTLSREEMNCLSQIARRKAFAGIGAARGYREQGRDDKASVSMHEHISVQITKVRLERRDSRRDAATTRCASPLVRPDGRRHASTTSQPRFKKQLKQKTHGSTSLSSVEPTTGR